MAPRDTIIDVTDSRLGFKARIRVPFDLLQLALRDSSEDYLASGRPVPSVKGARDHICLQAKQALAKKGRIKRYLPWSDIEVSVRASDQVAARGTRPITTRSAEPKSIATEAEPLPATGQLSFFSHQLSFF